MTIGLRVARRRPTNMRVNVDAFTTGSNGINPDARSAFTNGTSNDTDLFIKGYNCVCCGENSLGRLL